MHFLLECKHLFALLFFCEGTIDCNDGPSIAVDVDLKRARCVLREVRNDNEWCILVNDDGAGAIDASDEPRCSVAYGRRRASRHGRGREGAAADGWTDCDALIRIETNVAR